MPWIVGIGGELDALDLVALIDRRSARTAQRSDGTATDRAIADATALAGATPDIVVRCAGGSDEIDRALAAALAAAENDAVLVLEETERGALAIVLSPREQPAIAHLVGAMPLDDAVGLADIGRHPRAPYLDVPIQMHAGTTALVSADANLASITDAAAVPSLCGIASVAMALYDRRIPAFADAAEDDERNDDGRFYFPAFPHPWVQGVGGKRCGLALLPGGLPVMLGEAQSRRVEWRNAGDVAPYIQRVSAPDSVLLADALDRMASAEPAASNGNPIASLVAGDGDAAARAAATLSGKLRAGTPIVHDVVDAMSGSSVVLTPQGAAPIAFVFPGFGSSHTGLGDRLLDGAPHLLDTLEHIYGDRLRDIFPIAELYRGRGRQARRGATLPGTVSGVTSDFFFPTLYATIARDLLGLKPSAAIGVSLGGSAMLPALCREPSDMARLLLGQPGAIAGTLAITHGAHRVLDAEEDALPDDEWTNYWMIGPVERLLPKFAAEKDVFPCIVCHDSLLLIGGANGAIRRFAKENDAGLRPMGARLRDLHTPRIRALAASQFDPMAEIVAGIGRDHIKGIDFYVSERPIRAGASRAALTQYMQHQLDALCEPFDLPTIVRAAYRRGIRIFVECGPLDHTTRWIKRILDPLPHVAVALAPSHLDGWHGIVAAGSQLANHGIATALPSNPPWLTHKPALPGDAR